MKKVSPAQENSNNGKSEQKGSLKLPKREDIFTIKNLYMILAVALGAYLMVQTVRSIRITYQKLEIFELARQEVQELRVDNIELILLSERVVSEQYIEAAARDRLNYAKDGEILFIIPDELMEDKNLSNYIERFGIDYKEEIPQEKSNIEVWYEFIRFGV